MPEIDETRQNIDIRLHVAVDLVGLHAVDPLALEQILPSNQLRDTGHAWLR